MLVVRDRPHEKDLHEPTASFRYADAVPGLNYHAGPSEVTITPDSTNSYVAQVQGRRRYPWMTRALGWRHMVDMLLCDLGLGVPSGCYDHEYCNYFGFC